MIVLRQKGYVKKGLVRKPYISKWLVRNLMLQPIVVVLNKQYWYTDI